MVALSFRLQNGVYSSKWRPAARAKGGGHSNKHQLTHFARRLFYLAIIQPDLEYAAVSTVPFMSASLRGRLCSVWRRAVRCIAGADWQADVAPLLKNHRLTHIEHRWALQIAACHPQMYSKISPSDPLQETNFHRSFTPN